jgi:poly(A) polymerase
MAKAPRPQLVHAMFDHGLLTLVLAAAPRPSLLARLTAIETAQGLGADAILRLAVLAVEVAEDADRLRDRLRLSNEEHARLARLGVRRARIAPDGSERTARAHLYEAGGATFGDGVLTSWARSGAPPDDPAWLDLYRLPQRWQPPRFPLSGDDVMALGIPAGPRFGQLLRAAEAWWIAGDFAADASALRAKLEELAGRA